MFDLEEQVVGMEQEINTLFEKLGSSPHGKEQLENAQIFNYKIEWPANVAGGVVPKNISVATSMYYYIAIMSNILNKGMNELSRSGPDEMLIVNSGMSVMYLITYIEGTLVNETVLMFDIHHIRYLK